MGAGGESDEGKILSAIAEAFGAEIITEEEYWNGNNETEEDRNRALQKAEEKCNKEEAVLLAEIIKCAKGESHSLKPGSVELLKGDIAKCLFEYNPKIVNLPSDFEEFMIAIDKAANASDFL